MDAKISLSISAQAVPLAAGGVGLASEGPAPTAYEWSENLNDGTLLAVGGSTPSTVHLWNLQHELCVEQVITHSLACELCGGSDILSIASPANDGARTSQGSGFDMRSSILRIYSCSVHAASTIHHGSGWDTAI